MRQFINYKNILTAQVPSTLNFLTKIISENNFEYIIEIGTNRGGLTLWLNDNKHSNCKIYSFEIFPEIPLFKNEDIDGRLIIGDIFSAECKDLIYSLIKENKQCLILCDGGNKNQEFNLFSSYLKSNDVIMLHDYYDNNEEYLQIQKETGWQTAPESDLNSIKNSLEVNNLIPYNYELGKKSLWGSFIKK
jgi:hypothetical protein